MRKFLFLASEVVGIAALASTLVLAGLLLVPLSSIRCLSPVALGHSWELFGTRWNGSCEYRQHRSQRGPRGKPRHDHGLRFPQVVEVKLRSR